MARTRTKTCTSHCRGCGYHFAGDTAFDRHRVGEFDSTDDPRRCEDPADMTTKQGDPLYVRLEGECHVDADWQGEGVKEEIHIYALAAGYTEEAKARVAKVFA
jgi:hypothetical protein